MNGVRHAGPVSKIGVAGVSVMVVFAFGCASTQSGLPPAPPPPENAADYYPLIPGWKWAYEVEQEKTGSILATYAVLERVVDTVFVQFGDERLAYTLLPEGIAQRSGLDPGDYVLKSPIRAGASWPVNGGEARVVSVGKTMTVPGGTFRNCATIEVTRNGPPRVSRTIYAAGVGPISIEYQVQDPVLGRFNTELRAVLRGVTRPGEDPLGPIQK
jgi:hypothetical protein